MTLKTVVVIIGEVQNRGGDNMGATRWRKGGDGDWTDCLNDDDDQKASLAFQWESLANTCRGILRS